MSARGLVIAGYFTLVGYALAKTGAAGRAAKALRLMRDDMIRHDFLVANDLALALEQLRAQNRADVSRETPAPGVCTHQTHFAEHCPQRDVSRETSAGGFPGGA